MAQQMGFIALGWVMVLQKGGITQYQGFYGLHLGLHRTINEICSSSGGVYDTLNRVYITSGGDLTPREGVI